MNTLHFTTEELNAEQWRPIPVFSNYEASSLGRIRRACPGKGTEVGRILKPGNQPNGYLGICLSTSEGISRVLIHRVIAAAFIGPRPKGATINHIDGCKVNNRSNNLEYCTLKENLAHAKALNLIPKGESHHAAKLTAADVSIIHKMLDDGHTGREIAKHFPVHESNISHIKKGYAWRGSKPTP